MNSLGYILAVCQPRYPCSTPHTGHGPAVPLSASLPGRDGMLYAGELQNRRGKIGDRRKRPLDRPIAVFRYGIGVAQQERDADTTLCLNQLAVP